MIIILYPLLVCFFGILVYALSDNAKVSELGRVAYACGLLITLALLATHVAKIP